MAFNMAKHSTYMALLDMYSSISKAVDNKDFSLGVFLDLSKAFDTVDHTILYIASLNTMVFIM